MLNNAFDAFIALFVGVESLGTLGTESIAFTYIKAANTIVDRYQITFSIESSVVPIDAYFTPCMLLMALARLTVLHIAKRARTKVFIVSRLALDANWKFIIIVALFTVLNRSKLASKVKRIDVIALVTSEALSIGLHIYTFRTAFKRTGLALFSKRIHKIAFSASFAECF